MKQDLNLFLNLSVRSGRGTAAALYLALLPLVVRGEVAETQPIEKAEVYPPARLAGFDPHAPGIRLVGVTRLYTPDARYGSNNTGIKVRLAGRRGQKVEIMRHLQSGLVQGRWADDRGRRDPDLFRVNRQGTLAALNYRPFHKGGDVVLVREGPKGKLCVDDEFDYKVDILCDQAGHKIESDRFWVDRINGDIVTVCADDFAKKGCEHVVRVRVNQQGSLQLVSYAVRTGDDYETGPESRFEPRPRRPTQRP